MEIYYSDIGNRRFLVIEGLKDFIRENKVVKEKEGPER